MNTTKEQRKKVALKALKQLDVYTPYIKGLKYVSLKTSADFGFTKSPK